MLFIGVLLLILYTLNKSREHLTPGPPTLLTLQTDTQDLDSRLTQLKSEFDKMSDQAKQGADAAAQSKAQAALLKNS
jgi:uncharacterized phage infection (PIP) family protein YhgE